MITETDRREPRASLYLTTRDDVAGMLARWRRRPMTVVLLALGLVASTGIVLVVGGPPTAWTHVCYFVVLGAAMIWGPWWGLASGALGGVMVGPVPMALLGRFDVTDSSWVVRGVAMALVGLACGGLARMLLHEVEELETLNQEITFAFVRAIDARDPNTARHSELVADYSAALAEALQFDPESVRRIRSAALLHDVGKLGLERSILQKPGALNDDEWSEVREHPVLSERILSGVQRFASFLPGARHHHERYDGGGYPDGLSGEGIPRDARIIAVADAYDAMTSDRAYRTARSHEQAVEQLVEGSGSQFDPACVAAFLTLGGAADGSVPGAVVSRVAD